MINDRLADRGLRSTILKLSFQPKPRVLSPVARPDPVVSGVEVARGSRYSDMKAAKACDLSNGIPSRKRCRFGGRPRGRRPIMGQAVAEPAGQRRGRRAWEATP